MVDADRIPERAGRKTGFCNIWFWALLMLPVSIILFSFKNGISGNDFWWHVKVGEWICQHGRVPTEDIFSWYGTAKEIPWTAHEWLADVIFYCIHSMFGEKGIFLMSLFAALLLTVLLWNQVKESIQRNMLIGGLFFALLSVSTSLFFYGRPHIFSFFLLLFQLKILYGYMENPSRKSIWLLPLIACLWSNLHGGAASLTYILTGICLMCGALDFRFGRLKAERLERKAWLRLLAVLVVSIAAFLLNPIGLRVLIYPYTSFSDTLMMHAISEWTPPDAKDMGNLVLYFLPIGLITLGFLTEKKDIRLVDLAVMGLFLLLFFRSCRFIMFWYIAACFYGFPYLPACKIKPIKGWVEKSVVACAGIAMAGMFAFSVYEIISSAGSSMMVDTVITRSAVEAIQSDHPQRIFNDYDLGETLIYNDIPVFFDARADLYAYDNIMADGVSLMMLEQGNPDAHTAYVDVDNLIQKYGFDAIAVLRIRPLYTYLRSRPQQFRLVYEDSTVAYYRIQEES